MKKKIDLDAWRDVCWQTGQVQGASTSRTEHAQVTNSVRVRSLPSTSANSFGLVPVNLRGTIQEGPVSADGYIWYKVEYTTGISGWSVSDGLEIS